MYLNSDYLTPVELTGYVRQALMDLERNQFTLSRYLPSQTINDLDYRFTRGGEGLMEAATYRAYDAEAPTTSRPGVSRVSGELPPLSRKIRLGEYDRLRQRNLGSEVRNAILDDAERVARQIAARIEVARGDALVNASVTISENNVAAVVDFGRSSAMEVSADTAGDFWDGTAPTPLQDLLTWRDAYVEQNGSEPGVIVANRKILSHLMKDDEIRNLVFPTGSTQPAVVTESAVGQVLNAFGLPPISLYEAQVKVSGSATRIIPQTKILMLPAPGSLDGDQVGKTLWGTTAESLESEYGLGGQEAGIVAGAYHTFDPVAVWTKAAAIALPVLANPDLVMVADVLSA